MAVYTDKLMKLKAIEQIGDALNLYYQKKEDGKSLVDDAEIAKLETVEVNSQENVIEEIEINGVTASISDKKASLEIDAGAIDTISVNGTTQPIVNKNVNIVVPTNTSDLNNDSGFITNEADPTVPSYVKNITQQDITDWNNKSDFSGDYNDLSNKPTIPSTLSELTDDSTHRTVTDTEKTIWNNKSDFSGNYNDLTNKPEILTKDVNDLTYYELATATGNNIELSINSSTYVMTLNLKNSAGTTISTDTVDLPLESMVVSGSYDDTTKKIILTLQSGSTVEFSVADLVSGLQSEITSNSKLASDLVDDTNQVNKFTTTAEKNAWTAKYDKPANGIPSTDLDSAVQTSLGKADTALQSHQDISGKLDKTSVKTVTDTTQGNVYDVTYINTMIGDIESLLSEV